MLTKDLTELIVDPMELQKEYGAEPFHGRSSITLNLSTFLLDKEQIKDEARAMFDSLMSKLDRIDMRNLSATENDSLGLRIKSSMSNYDGKFHHTIESLS